MTDYEFEQFVQENGNDILNFCKMQTMNIEYGNELYQDTMLKLLEKQKTLDGNQNVKAYALSVSILLWKNKKKKYFIRNKIANFRSLDEIMTTNQSILEDTIVPSPEENVLIAEEVKVVQSIIAELPEKLKLPILLYYSSNMKIEEIADCLKQSPNTVKTRLRRAKSIIKYKLEALGYDR